VNATSVGLWARPPARSAQRRPSLVVDAWAKDSGELDDDTGRVTLSVADVRFVDEDLTTSLRQTVRRIAARLRSSGELILSVGLGGRIVRPTTVGQSATGSR
jgi:hypothetical protein